MAFYRNISMSFWTDSKVDDDFTPEDKYFFLYLMTNPHTNICGCYEISMKQMERETGYNTDTVKRLLHRMENTHNVIRYSEKTKEVLIVNWGKYNWSASEKVKKAVQAVAEHIKHDGFKKYVIDMVSIGYVYDMVPSITDTETESETETETETENRSRGRQSLPAPKHPTVENVEKYRQEIGGVVDAELFVDFYEANGWRQSNGNQIKDWKACYRSWNKREAGKPQQQKADSSFDLNDFDKLVNNF